MASFTDLIPQFNPYVQQLPVQAMVEVGMAKQKAYEENVTKIQAEIDRIAGLDIMRGVDKEYLQSKLNKLGNRLNLLAAGDFSNFQLANSVTGMAGQVGKDKYVQNAVASTAWYRKQAAEMEKAKSEGKSSVQNQWDFNQKVNTYLSSTDLERSFKDTYTPYTDVKKKAMEAIKQLHPNLMQYDIPFEIKDGKINTGKIADAMQRYKIEGIDEGQIQQAILATLSPDDVNQLSIDARYQFKDITSDQLVERAKLNYDVGKRDAVRSLDLLTKQKGTTTDPNALSKINQSIQYYEKLIGKDGKAGLLDEQLSDNLKNATNNPDGVKLSIYKDGFVKEFANAFTWKTQIEELQTSPVRQQMNWVAEMNHKQKVFNQSVYEFAEKMKREDARIQLDAEANALKKAELYGIDSPWTTVGNPTDNELRSVELFTEHANSVKGAIEGSKSQLAKAGFTEGQINEMVNKYQRDPSGSGIPAKALGAVQNILKNKNYLTSLETKEKQLRAEAEREVVTDPTFVKKIKDAETFAASINGGKALTLYGPYSNRTKSQPSKTVTPKEMIDKISSGRASFYMDAGQIKYVDNTDGFVVTMPRYASGADIVGGKQMRDVFSKIGEYSNKGYFKANEEKLNKVNDLYRKKLAPLAQEFVPQIKALGSSKDGSPTPLTVEQVSALVTARSLQGVAADENWDPATASDFLSEKKAKDTRVFVMQSGDNYELWIKNEKDPENIQKISLTQSEVAARFGKNYNNPRTQESYRLGVGRGSTNITGDPNEAMLQKQFGNFPGVRKYNITADLDEDVSKPGEYIPKINVMAKDGTYIPFEIAGSDKFRRFGFEQGRNQLNALTDAQLIKLLKEHYPNFDYSTLQTY